MKKYLTLFYGKYLYADNETLRIFKKNSLIIKTLKIVFCIRINDIGQFLLHLLRFGNTDLGLDIPKYCDLHNLNSRAFGVLIILYIFLMYQYTKI